MKRYAVKSRAVHALGYDADRELLVVEWKSGRAYEFSGVPRDVFEWLLAVPSKGGFINRMIRDRYPERRIPDRPVEAEPLLELLERSLESIDEAHRAADDDDRDD